MKECFYSCDFRDSGQYKEKVLASTSFNVFGRAGFYTDVTYGFLTADPDGGIIFDPSFDGESEIEVPVHPQK